MRVTYRHSSASFFVCLAAIAVVATVALCGRTSLTCTRDASDAVSCEYHDELLFWSYGSHTVTVDPTATFEADQTVTHDRKGHRREMDSLVLRTKTETITVGSAGTYQEQLAAADSLDVFLHMPQKRSYTTACGSRWPSPWLVGLAAALVLVAVYFSINRYVIRVAPGNDALLVERSRLPFPAKRLHALPLSQLARVEIEETRGRRSTLSRLVFVMEDGRRIPLTSGFSNIGSNRAATVVAIHQAVARATGRFLPSPPVSPSPSAVPFFAFAGVFMAVAVGALFLLATSRSTTHANAPAAASQSAAPTTPARASSSAPAKPTPSSCHCDAGDTDCMISCVMLDPTH